jgi:hypothetical protein
MWVENKTSRRRGVNPRRQLVIGAVEVQVKSLRPGEERHFYNRASHAPDDKRDLDKALHILHHVRDFMRAYAKGGLAE